MNTSVPEGTYRGIRQQKPLVDPHFHSWKNPEGEDWVNFYRSDKYFTLRFPGLADYTISKDQGVIAIYPVPGADKEVVDTLYFNHVLPLLYSHQNRLVLHASAIVSGSEAAVFVGPSGVGKSTLAASFVAQSVPCACDEAAVIECREGEYFVQSGCSAIHLSEPIARAIVPPLANTASQPLGKKLIPLSDSQRCTQDQVPLGRLFLLAPGQSNAVTIEPLSPSGAVSALLQNSFLLDVEDRSALTQRLEQVSDLGRAFTVHRLCYPHDLGYLPQVHAKVKEQMEAGAL